MSSLVNFVKFVILPVLLVVFRRPVWGILNSLSKPSKEPRPSPQVQHNKDDVVPLPNYDYLKVEPIKYRPFKSSAHVAMGITKKSRNDWIHIDRLYLDRLKVREHIIKDNPEVSVCTSEEGAAAVAELYTDLLTDYLPKRYPTIFKASGKTITNTAAGTTYPVSTKGLTPEDMLKILGVNVEDDFFFMCPDGLDGDYRLAACIGCFPNGFLSPALIGKSVRQIHQPVPGYEQRLGNGVDKYFQLMKPGHFIGRMNWSLQVDGADLCRTQGLNYYAQSERTTEEQFDAEFERCFLRVEHQTLVRLAKTRAIMFCVHSYMTPLDQIRREGDGPQLADAIESYPEQLGLYKRRHFWGEKVLPWLRRVPEN